MRVWLLPPAAVPVFMGMAVLVIVVVVVAAHRHILGPVSATDPRR